MMLNRRELLLIYNALKEHVENMEEIKKDNLFNQEIFETRLLIQKINDELDEKSKVFP